MQILGIDIGGSGIKGAVVETDTGELFSERLRIKTPSPADPSSIAECVLELVSKIGFDGPVACGFPARIIDGIVQTAANVDKSWIGVNIEALFSTTLSRPVFAVNDADAAGLAELRFGSVKDNYDPVLFLTVGTGIGSALFVDGKMFPNTELGHLKFKGDIAERYCSSAAREKEDLSWKEWGRRFNEYLEYVCFILAPKVIVIGGGVSKKFEKYQDQIKVKTKVIPAVNLNLAGIIGAAVYGKTRLEKLNDQEAKAPQAPQS